MHQAQKWRQILAAMGHVHGYRPHKALYSGRTRSRQRRQGRKADPAAQRQLGALNAAARDNRIAQAVSFFEQKGWTHKQAAGIVANLKIESGLNPNAVGDGGKAYGIAQWHPPRQAEFRRAFGKDIRAATLTEQLEFQNH